MSKLSKSEVKYTPKAKMPSERCAICSHYEGNGLCKIVKGYIDPKGWCEEFKR